MQIRRSYLVFLAVLALVIAACGGDEGSDTTAASGGDDGGVADTTTTTAGEAPETTANSGSEEPPPAEVTEMGSFTVNGTEFAVNILNRCIPFSGPDSSDIDLQPIAQGQGAGLNLYGNGDSVEVSVQGSTIDDMFGSIAFSANEATENTLDGDRWSGSATLEDPFEEADPVEVTWDVMVPGEMRDCSL